MTTTPFDARRWGKAARIGAHVAHHVQLPHRIPVRVRNLLEPRLDRDADVVDEHVEPAERIDGLLDETRRRVRLGQVGANMERFTTVGRVAATAADDTGSLGHEQLGRLEPDPTGRAGDDAALFRSVPDWMAGVTA